MDRNKHTADRYENEYRYDMEDEKSILEEVFSFLKTFLLLSVVILLFTSLLYKPNVVSGRSMYPTLYPNDKGFSNVIGLYLDGIERGDIVTAKMLNDEDGKLYDVVKRVIGLPGDTIEGKNEAIYINGEKLEEPWLDENYVQAAEDQYGYFNSDFGPVTLKEDEYYLLGDNRPISKDSRDVGPFAKDDIKAKGFMVLFPFSRISYKE